jgi:hypothetical protein
MPEEVGVRPLDGGHQIFVGNRSLDITDSQLLILSRLISTYLRRVVSGRLPKARGDLSPIAPIPVTDIRLNEDALGTQVHLTIDDVAGGSFDYALSSRPPIGRTPGCKGRTDRSFCQRSANPLNISSLYHLCRMPSKPTR